jgi:hypothetical protein
MRHKTELRTHLKNASKSPWRRCGLAQNAHPASGGTARRPAFAENLYLINRSEVPPSGGALNPDPHF